MKITRSHWTVRVEFRRDHRYDCVLMQHVLVRVTVLHRCIRGRALAFSLTSYYTSLYLCNQCTLVPLRFKDPVGRNETQPETHQRHARIYRDYRFQPTRSGGTVADGRAPVYARVQDARLRDDDDILHLHSLFAASRAVNASG